MLEFSHFFEPKTCANRNCDVLITLDHRRKNNSRYGKKTTAKMSAKYNRQSYCSLQCTNKERNKLIEDKNLKKYYKANKICSSCKNPIPAIYIRGFFKYDASTKRQYCDEICRWFGSITDRATGYNSFEKINLINSFRKNNEDFILFRFVHAAVGSSYHTSISSNKEFNIDLKYCFNLFPRDFICPVNGTKMNLHSEVDVGKRNANKASLDRTNSNLGYVKGNVDWMSWGANWSKNDLSRSELNKFLQYFDKIESKRELF